MGPIYLTMPKAVVEPRWRSTTSPTTAGSKVDMLASEVEAILTSSEIEYGTEGQQNDDGGI
jgi:hypothetical protein